MTTVVLSGNRAGWLAAAANTLMDRGADEAPLSTDDLTRRVPDQVGTARNDGHVTAAESGLDRNDYKAGYRLWIEGCVTALRKAKLVDGPDDALRWVGDSNRTHKVSFCGELRTIHGRPQRQEARDRYMLGDPDHDWTAPNLGADGRVLRGDSPPLPVNVSRGKMYATIKDPSPALEIHPLALAIPPMTPAEQQLVRGDIERHGVKVPILMYPDNASASSRGKPKMKVLDGRHRAYFASVTGQPIVLEEFVGTEQEARDHVASLNLHRRHLTRQQRAVAATRLYGEQARKEAKEAQREGQDRGRRTQSVPGKITLNQNGHSDGKKTHERVRELAGGDAAGFSIADAKAAEIIVRAPNTAAKVDMGEIAATSRAVREARAELGERPVEPPEAGGAISAPRSAQDRLGQALYQLKILEQEWPTSQVPANAAELDARLADIIKRAQRLRHVLFTAPT